MDKLDDTREERISIHHTEIDSDGRTSESDVNDVCYFNKTDIRPTTNWQVRDLQEHNTKPIEQSNINVEQQTTYIPRSYEEQPYWPRSYDYYPVFQRQLAPYKDGYIVRMYNNRIAPCTDAIRRYSSILKNKIKNLI